MRLAADSDALEFADSVAELLKDVASPAALRLAWDDVDGRIPGVWKRLAESGLLGLSVPEPYGGSGADLTTLLPALIEVGRAVLPEPVVETLVGSVLLAQCGGDVAAEWLPRVVAGDAVIAVRLGPGSLVSAAPWADLLLLQQSDGAIVAAPREDVTLTIEESVDRGMRLATVDVADGTLLSDVDPDVAFDLGAVAYAALLTGAAKSMLAVSVSYAKQREQFGVPIGSFQAIKHQLANAYVGNVFASPVVARGAWSVAQNTATRSRDASHAKHVATVSAQQAARTALQVHAGIGYTFEHDLHMWMKRTWTLSSLWGTAAWHKARVAEGLLR